MEFDFRARLETLSSGKGPPGLANGNREQCQRAPGGYFN